MKDRLTAWELWWIFADRFLDWEEGVWRTFIKMIKKPGEVIRHFLGGKRKSYLNPFSYLLFCITLYGFGQLLMRRLSGVTDVSDLQAGQQWVTALDNAEDEYTLIAYGTVLVVAVLALAMRMIFDGRLLNSVEAIVTALYASGNVFLLTLLVSLGELILTGSPLSYFGLSVTFMSLFPFSLGHTGYHLFGGWTMVGYTAVAPLMAGLMGGFFGYAVLRTIGSFLEAGVVVPIVGSIIIFSGPVFVIVLYFLDLLG